MRQSFEELTRYTRFRGYWLVQFDRSYSRQTAHMAAPPHQAEYRPHVGVSVPKTLTRTPRPACGREPGGWGYCAPCEPLTH